MEAVKHSQLTQMVTLLTICGWSLFAITDANIFYVLIPLGSTIFCCMTWAYMADEFDDYYGPIASFQIYRLKKYKHYRQLVKLNESQRRLQVWLSSQDCSETKEKMQNSLCEFDNFIINGFKMDYLARMSNELKKDANLLNIKVFDDDTTYEDVENYLINGMQDTTEMDRIYAELDQKFGIAK